MHGTQLIVELRQHDPADHGLFMKELADQRKRLGRVSELPAHEEHQTETKKEEQEPGLLEPFLKR